MFTTREFRGFVTVVHTLQDRVGTVTRTVWSSWYKQHEQEVKDCFLKGMSPQEAFASVSLEAP